VVLEPYIWDEEAPKVEHGMALEGIAIVPVGLAGKGLIPADVISVEPSGIPVGETDDALPSGEVAPIVGVGTTIPPTCAAAMLHTSSAAKAVAIGENRIDILRFRDVGTRRDLLTFANVA
jgi:hypothetical protein